MTQTQAVRPPRRRSFFATVPGGLTIAAVILISVAAVVYIGQLVGSPSYEERRQDAELACAEHIDLEGTDPFSQPVFEDCVAYEMGR